MEIDFDVAEDRANRRKHGVGLAMAAAIFAGPYVEKADERFDDGEDRWSASGLIAGRVFVCIYTMRGEICRVISLRHATKAETDDYYQALGR